MGYRETLAESLPRVRERIAGAAETVGRDPAEVTLVAITKAHPLEALHAALEAGLADLGENRVDELEEKVGALGRAVARWHMVGHVQSRKAGRALGVADLIHSVDTVKLAERMSRLASENGGEAAVLVQVNASREERKSGLDAEAAVEEVHRIAELPGLSVRGLMTMAPFTDDERVLSATFARLRDVRDEVRRTAPTVGTELSMGMTNDLEVAVREGSTMVRIGTALFGERER